MTATGVRIQPSTSVEQLRALSSIRAKWQVQAWGYRDLIPELRYATQFRARAISKVRFYVAQVNPDPSDNEPISLALRLSDDAEKAARVTVSSGLAAAAEEELARLPLEQGYSFIGRWSENQDIAGEAWLHGYPDPATGEETWKIRSTSEIEVSADARQVILKDPSLLGAQRRLDLGVVGEERGTEELYRLWVEHPEKSHEADSACRSMLSVLEEVVLVGREIRAASRSRIAANGLLLIPRGLTLPLNTRDDTEEAEDPDTAMAQDLQLALVTPISNEGDAGQIAPVMITGEIADLKEVRHLRMEREDSPKLLEKQGAALSRMGNGLDIPPEVITGMSAANHWSAWQIDQATVSHHLEPSVRLMADSLTSAFLRAALVDRGFSHAEVRHIVVWYDLGGLTENPNRREDAIEARKTGDIGPAAYRRALGFNDEDAPTPEEMLYMIAMSSGMDQATATAIMTAYAQREAGGTLEIDVPDVPAAIGSSSPRAPSDSPRPVGPGDTPGSVPDTAPVGVTAAAWLASPERLAVLERAANALAERLGGNALTPEASGGGGSGPAQTIIHSGLTAAAEAVPEYRLALEDARSLMDTDRAIRAQVHAAAEASLQRALERAGARLRGKATADRELSLSLKGLDSLAVLVDVGRARAFALGGTDEHLLADAFRELEGTFLDLVTLGITAIVDRVLRMLRLKRDSGLGKTVAQRMTQRMAARIDEGWASLHATLLDRAREKMFGDGPPDTDEGELVAGAVPPYAVRTALAIVGGLPATSAGLDSYGRSVDGEPVGGLANGDTVTREIEEAGGELLGYTWVYGITPLKRKFDPHLDLEGKRFANWDDPILDTVDNYAGRYAWVGPHFRPGDHGGCMCDYVPAYALPEYGDQVDERLRIPTKGMREILMLAQGDDRAGRTGTDAQGQRDVWNQVQELQSRFIKGGAA
jgi:hypothetical protein